MRFLSPQGHFRPVVKWIILGIFLGSVAALQIFELYREHQRLIDTETRRLDLQARVVERNLGRQFFAVRSALQNIRGEVPNWRRAQDWQVAAKRLHALSEAMPGVRTFLILDDAGTVLASNRSELIGQNVAYREYFQGARAGRNADMLYLSPPFQSLLGVFTMNATLALSDDQGAFAGAVSASIDPDYFLLLLDSVRYADDMRVSLAHGKGATIVAAPPRPAAASTSAGQPAADSASSESNRQAIVPDERQITVKVSFQPQDFPIDNALSITAQRKLDAVLASWIEDLRENALAFTLVAVVTIVALFLMIRRQAAFDLARSREEAQRLLAASVFENALEGIALTNPSGKIFAVNPAFVAITRYAQAEAVGLHFRQLLADRHSPEYCTELWEQLGMYGRWEGELWSRRKSGESLPVMLSISQVRDAAGELSHCIAVFSDVSREKEQEERLYRLAHHDALTGLVNRSLLFERLNAAVVQAKRTMRPLAVCYLDLDGFKPINDRLGHAAGDTVLIEVAARLREAVRNGDTVARMGGDEFVLLLTVTRDDDDFLAAAARILAAISEDIVVGDEVVRISGSMGITCYPLDDAAPNALLQHADQAMYLAKKRGRNCSCIYDPESAEMAGMDIPVPEVQPAQVAHAEAMRSQNRRDA